MSFFSNTLPPVGTYAAPNQGKVNRGSQNGWLQTVAKINNQLLVPLSLLYFASLFASAEAKSDCIHDCKEAVFNGKNNFWTNGFCGIKCALPYIRDAIACGVDIWKKIKDEL